MSTVVDPDREIEETNSDVDVIDGDLSEGILPKLYRKVHEAKDGVVQTVADIANTGDGAFDRHKDRVDKRDIGQTVAGSVSVHYGPDQIGDLETTLFEHFAILPFNVAKDGSPSSIDQAVLEQIADRIEGSLDNRANVTRAFRDLLGDDYEVKGKDLIAVAKQVREVQQGKSNKLEKTIRALLAHHIDYTNLSVAERRALIADLYREFRQKGLCENTGFDKFAPYVKNNNFLDPDLAEHYDELAEIFPSLGVEYDAEGNEMTTGKLYEDFLRRINYARKYEQEDQLENPTFEEFQKRNRDFDKRAAFRLKIKVNGKIKMAQFCKGGMTDEEFTRRKNIVKKIDQILTNARTANNAVGATTTELDDELAGALDDYEHEQAEKLFKSIDKENTNLSKEEEAKVDALFQELFEDAHRSDAMQASVWSGFTVKKQTFFPARWDGALFLGMKFVDVSVKGSLLGTKFRNSSVRGGWWAVKALGATLDLSTIGVRWTYSQFSYTTLFSERFFRMKADYRHPSLIANWIHDKDYKHLRNWVRGIYIAQSVLGVCKWGRENDFRDVDWGGNKFWARKILQWESKGIVGELIRFGNLRHMITNKKTNESLGIAGQVMQRSMATAPATSLFLSGDTLIMTAQSKMSTFSNDYFTTQAIFYDQIKFTGADEDGKVYSGLGFAVGIPPLNDGKQNDAKWMDVTAISAKGEATNFMQLRLRLKLFQEIFEEIERHNQLMIDIAKFGKGQKKEMLQKLQKKMQSPAFYINSLIESKVAAEPSRFSDEDFMVIENTFE